MLHGVPLRVELRPNAALRPRRSSPRSSMCTTPASPNKLSRVAPRMLSMAWVAEAVACHTPLRSHASKRLPRLTLNPGGSCTQELPAAPEITATLTSGALIANGMFGR
ncbi:hypothetical protein D3C84_828960 [compost metagenome]